MTPMTLWQRAQNYFLVTALAVLVWFYAEGENVKQHDLEFMVQFAPPAGRKLVLEPDQQRVWVQVRCTAGQLTQLQKLSKEGIQLELSDDPNQLITQRWVNLREALAKVSPINRLAGVEVRSTNPEFAQVKLERLVQRTLEVVVNSGKVELANIPTCNPSQVKLEMTESLAQSVNGLKVEAQLNPEDLHHMEANVSRTLEAPLVLPPALEKPNVTMIDPPPPGKASVIVVVANRTKTLTLTNVPIIAALPFSEMGNWTAKSDPEGYRDVELAGSSDAIEKIDKDRSDVYAIARLTTSQLAEGRVTVTPELHLPAGVRPQAPLRPVNVTIRPRGDVPAPLPSGG